MSRRKSDRYWGARNRELATQREADPFIRLGFAILKQATKDLKEADPLDALDSLCWWLEDGQEWLTMLDVCDSDKDSYFSRLIEGCYENRKVSGYTV